MIDRNGELAGRNDRCASFPLRTIIPCTPVRAPDSGGHSRTDRGGQAMPPRTTLEGTGAGVSHAHQPERSGG